MSGYSCADRGRKFDVLQLMERFKRRHAETIVWLTASAIDMEVGHRSWMRVMRSNIKARKNIQVISDGDV